jgi:hypothetical protein
MDAAVERTGMYLQGELRSKRGCPGVQRVQKTYVDQLLYSLVRPWGGGEKYGSGSGYFVIKLLTQSSLAARVRSSTPFG